MTNQSHHISVDPRIESIVMPENVKIGLMIAEHRKKCDSIDCSFDYHAFAIGQSPFHIPRPLKDALAANVHQGHYSAAAGIKELREAIAGFNERHFKLEVDPELIVIGHGTKGMIFTIFSMIKGHVLIPAPSWISYVPQIKMLDKQYHILHLNSKNDYKLQPDDLDSFLSSLHKDQHLLILNNPHNPTGAVYSKNELEALAEVCYQHQILVLADEIYALSTYDFENFISMRSIYPEGTFVTNGISKDRGAAGYRLGHCILPAKCSDNLQLAFKKIAATVYTNVSTPTQYAAIPAYEPNETIEEYFRITREIHRIMGVNLSNEFDKIEGIKSSTPKGGFYFLLDFNELKEDLFRNNIMSSNDLASSMLKHPFHFGALTGDSILLKQDDFSARIAFVDYPGRNAFDNFVKDSPKSKSDEITFFRQNAPRMAKSVEVLQSFVESLKK